MSRQRVWRTTEVQHLRMTYPHEPTAYVAAELGRSLQSVYHKAKQMRLRKSAVYLSQMPPNARSTTA